MDGLLKFKCECCGEMIDQWPALAFGTPSPYFELSEKEKKEMAMVSSDFCVIAHPDQTDRFIRTVMYQKVNDHCTDLEYGFWVSLSEKSFLDYYENFDRDDYEATYFGYISNVLPDYPNMLFIPAKVVTRTGGQRPEIFPKEDFDHPFVRDFYQGISKQEAEHRIKELFLNKLPKN